MDTILIGGEKINKKNCLKCGIEYPETEEFFYKQKVVTKKGIKYRLMSECKK